MYLQDEAHDPLLEKVLLSGRLIKRINCLSLALVFRIMFLPDSFDYAPVTPFSLQGSPDFGNEHVIVLDGNIQELGQSNQFPTLALIDTDDDTVLNLIINSDYSKIEISSQLNVRLKNIFFCT